MPHFINASPKLSAKLVNKNIHGGNHAPKAADWWSGDDTLDRQGVSHSKPKGHGICKGVASSWVIAFLNGSTDATDPKKYETYYTNYLRFQATMIKDFGKHIDSHVSKLSDVNMDANVKVSPKIDVIKFEEKMIPDGRWGAYISVWHHDIAIGGKWGAGNTLYINEPNTGLMAYSDKAKFLTDLNAYMAKRRQKKKLSAVAKAGFWMCAPA